MEISVFFFNSVLKKVSFYLFIYLCIYAFIHVLIIPADKSWYIHILPVLLHTHFNGGTCIVTNSSRGTINSTCEAQNGAVDEVNNFKKKQVHLESKVRGNCPRNFRYKLK